MALDTIRNAPASKTPNAMPNDNFFVRNFTTSFSLASVFTLMYFRKILTGKYKSGGESLDPPPDAII